MLSTGILCPATALSLARSSNPLRFASMVIPVTIALSNVSIEGWESSNVSLRRILSLEKSCQFEC